MALASLPERRRRMLLLKAHGYTQEEIGRRFGVSQPQVSRNMLSAKAALSEAVCL